MLRLIRQHPIVGLLLALSLEAWMALPGEAMIAVAASATVSRACGIARVALGGVVGMLVNDLVLFSLSRVGRGILVHWIGLHTLRFHLSAQMMVGMKFLPPLRSAANLIYGLQGVPLSRFLAVSMFSSALWIGVYSLLGHCFHRRIEGVMEHAERRGKWMTLAETGLSLALVAAAWL